jgi:metallo-beta-lactamase class B
LGNLSDAVVDEWDDTIQKILNKYKEVKTVIPGHGNSGNIELLYHTLHLVEKEKMMHE